MRLALLPVLFALVMLAGCEQTRSGAALGSALDAARRCSHCGWIESKEEILRGAADSHLARLYEYTVRMADGSSSVFREQLPVSWRLGERLVLIGGG
jgi:hypothetical protein